jgi:hypothetical protein
MTSGPKSRPSKKAGTKKLCLRCDRPFLSEGNYNRLCQRCRESLATLPTPEETYGLGRPGWE